jgi:hypothetical protein
MGDGKTDQTRQAKPYKLADCGGKGQTREIAGIAVIARNRRNRVKGDRNPKLRSFNEDEKGHA